MESKVSEPGVPLSGHLGATRGETHQPIYGQSEDVQATRRARYLGQQPPSPTPNPQNAVFDEDLVLVLVELAEADNVRRQLWDVVHPGQLLVFPALEPEEDGAATLDGHD